MADGVDAAVKTVQPSGAAALEHRGLAEAGRVKLGDGDHAVLTLGNACDLGVRGAFSVHRATKAP
jgi:hypothetical protein